MRAKFTAYGDRKVVAEYDYDDPIMGTERVSRAFGCRSDLGSYAHEIMRSGETRPICEGLSRRGNTLMVSAGEKLIDVIRREYRAMVRAERAEAA